MWIKLTGLSCTEENHGNKWEPSQKTAVYASFSLFKSTFVTSQRLSGFAIQQPLVSKYKRGFCLIVFRFFPSFLYPLKPFQVSITEWSSQSKLHEQKWILLWWCPWFLVGQKTMLIKTDFHDTQMRFVVIKQELRTYWTPVYSHTWLIAERFTTILSLQLKSLKPSMLWTQMTQKPNQLRDLYIIFAKAGLRQKGLWVVHLFWPSKGESGTGPCCLHTLESCAGFTHPV